MSDNQAKRSQALGIGIGDRVSLPTNGLSGSGATGTVVDVVGTIAVILRDGEPALKSAELVVPLDLLHRLLVQSPNPNHSPPEENPAPFWWRRRPSS